MSQVSLTGTKPHGFFKELFKNRVLFLMLLPGALVLFLYNYLPMFGMIIAFKNYKIFEGGFFTSLIKSDWCGITNFQFMFSTPDAYSIIRNTVLYNLGFIISCTVLSIAIAIALNEIFSRKLSKIYTSAMFLPYFLSWIVFSYLVYAYLSPDKGFINMSILKPLGIQPIYWYSETKYWPIIILIVNAWYWMGNNCIIYLATIVGVDQELYEAARMDGASRFQQIFTITIPQIMPVIIVMVLIFVGRIINTDLGLFLVVPRNAGMLFPVTQTIDTYVYNTLIRNGDIGMSSAAAFFQSVVGFIVVMISNYAVKKYDPDQAMF